ncbi:hypothetical protein IJM16_00570 [Candidatus Saccharibacteria bacterium]|nr:hypothetical protein [Candidatus Saccharibacteria bacterium]
MKTTEFSTTVGNVTYFNFPTYAVLCNDRPDVRQEMMIFFRLIGLCSYQQINVAIGNSPEDARVKHLLSEAGVNMNVNEGQSEENRQYAESLQREYLGEDPSSYQIDVSKLIVELHKIGYVKNCKKALESLLKAEQADRRNSHFQKTSQSKGSSKTEQPEINSLQAEQSKVEQGAQPSNNQSRNDHADDILLENKQPDVEQAESLRPKEIRPAPLRMEIKTFADLERAIKTIAAECPISPIHNFKEAKKTHKYFFDLIRYYPNVPANMLVHYLFGEGVSTVTVQSAIRNSGVRRGKGFRVNNDSIIERAAFVAWTNGDWMEYLEQEGSIEGILEAFAKKGGPESDHGGAVSEPAAEEASSSKAEAPCAANPQPQPEPVTPVMPHHETAPPEVPQSDLNQPKTIEAAETSPGQKATVSDAATKPRTKSNGPAIGIIKVAGTVSEILSVLMQLENDTRIEIKAFNVER